MAGRQGDTDVRRSVRFQTAFPHFLLCHSLISIMACTTCHPQWIPPICARDAVGLIAR